MIADGRIIKGTRDDVGCDGFKGTFHPKLLLHAPPPPPLHPQQLQTGVPVRVPGLRFIHRRRRVDYVQHVWCFTLVRKKRRRKTNEMIDEVCCVSGKVSHF